MSEYAESAGGAGRVPRRPGMGESGNGPTDESGERAGPERDAPQRGTAPGGERADSEPGTPEPAAGEHATHPSRTVPAQRATYGSTPSREALGGTETPTAGSVQGRSGRPWLRILLVGLALWVATVLVTVLTRNTNLLPTVILLGSFLVPVSFVAWAFTRDEGALGLRVISEAFLLGGVLGVLAAALLESYFLSPSPFMFVGVGLIEELAKGLALLFVARRVSYENRTTRHGLMLGAAVGFGFAAFETAGYAMNAMITVEGLDLRAVVETELLRSVLAPVGHGLWTAILGGLLFAAANRGRWRITGGVVLGYLGVSLLHALWDSSRLIALVFTLLLTGVREAPQGGYLADPTPVQVHVFTGLTWLTMVVVAVVGLIWLWATAGRRPRRASEPP